jgi:threonine/homoserine/homoserine lactone efflux protein
MTLFELFVLAYALGFLAAIPIGATQIEIARRAIADQTVAALMIVAGSVLSDAVYGAIALFGLAPFFRHRGVEAGFGLVGAALLLVLAYLAYRHIGDVETGPKPSRAVNSLPLSFATGFSLAVTNPPIMIWWLVGVKIARDLGLAGNFGPGHAAAFVGFGALGIGSYLLLLTFVLHRVKHMISPVVQRRVHIVMTVLLVGLALYLLVTGLRALHPPPSGGTALA